jgi:hypothetical protein
VALTQRSDDLTAQAQSLLDLAEVHHLGGRRRPRLTRRRDER